MSMVEVKTYSEELPQRKMNLSILLERNPIEECASVDDLIKCLQGVLVNCNRTALYTAYFIGLAFDTVLLEKKYNGMTTEKLAEALGLSRATAFRYRALTKILKPEEVDELGHIPYKLILRFPQIEKQFGSADMAQLKFRLKANDFEGIRGSEAFDKVLAEMAQKRLALGEMAPDIRETIEVEAEEVDDIDAEHHEVHNSCEDVELDYDEEAPGGGPNVVDALLKDRSKTANKQLDDSGKHTKSENKQRAEIALSQARNSLAKIRDYYTRVNMDSLSMLDRVWEQEDYIIGDPETEAVYREVLADFAAVHMRALEVVLKMHKGLQEHGECLRKVEVPEGTTPASLLDPKN
jgi:hypothetical protein